MDLQCKNELDNSLVLFKLLIEIVITFGSNYSNEGKHVTFHPLSLPPFWL